MNEASQILIKNGCVPDNKNPIAINQFQDACKIGNSIIVKAYLDLGMDVNAFGKENATALIKTTEGKRVPILKLLIKAGADLDAKDDDGDTALHTAVNWGHTEFTKELLKLGANPNTENNLLFTPLSKAIKEKNTELANLLISVGANVNHINAEGIPVLEVARIFNADYLNTLVENGADINLKFGDEEETLLHLELYKEDSDTNAQLLLKLGASTGISNKYGWNAHMIAIKKGFEDTDLMATLTRDTISDKQKTPYCFFRPARTVN